MRREEGAPSMDLAAAFRAERPNACRTAKRPPSVKGALIRGLGCKGKPGGEILSFEAACGRSSG